MKNGYPTMKSTVFLFLNALTIYFLTAFQAFAQPGCPDPQALNYNPSATANDGSCLYPPTGYPPVFKAWLPDELTEISGDVYAGGMWYAHNDGSGGPVFYRFNPETGALTQEIQLQNAANEDWEDVAAGAAHLYFGDFGNNLNDRQDLGVYKVPLSEIGGGNPEMINDDKWSFIPFAYADQADFSTQPADSTEFDCEAMIFFNGKLHLFTKNHKEYTTSHYVINQMSGKAEKIESFNSDGLITGADVSPDGKLIALSGYDLQGLPKVFVWLLWDWQTGSDFLFSGNKRRIELGSAFATGQTEGIGFSGNRTGYFTNERTEFNGVTFVEESVRYFDFSQYVPESVGTEEPPGSYVFHIFPNPFSQSIHFQFFENKKPNFLRVVNPVGQEVLRLNQVPESLDLSYLSGGIYTFEAVFGEKLFVVRVVKR